MAITNYCYNTYGLSPDFDFFGMSPQAQAITAESTAVNNKATFYTNYTHTYDNVISSMAVIDESISPGALYAEYRNDLGKKIYINGIHLQVPDTTYAFKMQFSLKEDVDYAGENTAGKLYYEDRPVAEVRIKNGMVYRLSSSEQELKIDGIGVGSNILDIVQKWGQPSEIDGIVYYYHIGESAKITLITSSDGFVTWMLYEGYKTELLKPDITKTEQPDLPSAKNTEIVEHSHPVAEAILQRHKDAIHKLK